MSVRIQRLGSIPSHLGCVAGPALHTELCQVSTDASGRQEWGLPCNAMLSEGAGPVSEPAPLQGFPQPAPCPWPSLDASQEVAGRGWRPDKLCQQGQLVPFCCSSQKTSDFLPSDNAARTVEYPSKLTNQGSRVTHLLSFCFSFLYIPHARPF